VPTQEPSEVCDHKGQGARPRQGAPIVSSERAKPISQKIQLYQYYICKIFIAFLEQQEKFWANCLPVIILEIVNDFDKLASQFCIERIDFPSMSTAPLIPGKTFLDMDPNCIVL
jgi:hypothetical protein